MNKFKIIIMWSDIFAISTAVSFIIIYLPLEVYSYVKPDHGVYTHLIIFISCLVLYFNIVTGYIKYKEYDI